MFAFALALGEQFPEGRQLLLGHGIGTVSYTHLADAAALFGDLPHLVIGRTLAEPELRVRDGEGAPLFTVGLDELREAWERPMRAVFH